MFNSLPEASCAAKLYFNNRFPGYRLKQYRTEESGRFCFILEPSELGVICPKCQQYCLRFKDTRTLTVLDYDNGAGGPCVVLIPRRRLRCRCKCTATEPMPSWILPKHRITVRLAAFAQHLLNLRVSISDVAALTGIDWDLLKEIDKSALELRFKNKDLGRVKRLAIDEISIHKKHQFATVFMDLENREILEVIKGKSIESIRPFFERLKADNFAENIQSVSVDMNAAYPKVIKEYLGNAKLAYDLFHVMQHFTTDVLKEAKKHSIAQARQIDRELKPRDKTIEAKQELSIAVSTVKNAEWLVVTDPSLLTPEKVEKLQRLRAVNRLFSDLYPLAAKLRLIWRSLSQEVARNELQETIELCEAIALEHDFKPIQKFAGMLKRRAEGIVNACRVGLGTNILEGANNTAKVIKRLAYGSKDFEYFKYKLMGAFPGRNCDNPLNDQRSFIWNGRVQTIVLPQ